MKIESYALTNKNKTVSFTGHRNLPKGLKLNTLKKRIVQEIEKSIAEGYVTFICGGAIGFDMLCGQAVLFLKKSNPHIKLVVAVPHPDQEKRWTSAEQASYRNLLASCDEVITLATTYSDGCYKVRNKYMVDNSSKVIAYYDGGFRSGTGQTVRIARSKNILVVNIYE